MKLVTQIFAAGMLGWLSALALFVALQAIRGRVVLSGLLAQTPGGSVTPERMLGVVITFVVAIVYIHAALQIDLSITNKPISLPELPDQFMNLLLGTNGIFLAGKFARSV